MRSYHMPIVSLLKGKSPGDPQAAGERPADCAIAPGIPHPIHGVSVSAHGRQCVQLQPKWLTTSLLSSSLYLSVCVCVHEILYMYRSKSKVIYAGSKVRNSKNNLTVMKNNIYIFMWCHGINCFNALFRWETERERDGCLWLAVLNAKVHLKEMWSELKKTFFKLFIWSNVFR